jgi:hypothetical protein
MANFNHMYFEDLMLSGEDLKPDQKQALEAHLQECEGCRQLSAAWHSVEHQLSSAPAFSPQPGFTARWLKRLEQDQQKIHRRQTLAILLFGMGGAALLLTSLGLLVTPILGSSKIYFLTWVYRWMSEITPISSAGVIVSNFMRTLINVIPPYGWMLIVGIASELLVIWFVTIRFLSNPRRVTA